MFKTRSIGKYSSFIVSSVIDMIISIFYKWDSGISSSHKRSELIRYRYLYYKL